MEIHEPIRRDKKLNVIVLSDDSTYGRNATRHGILLAEAFQASLSVIINFDFHLPEKGNDIEEKFLSDIKSILKDNGDAKIITEYVFPETLFQYAEEQNTALIVIGVSKERKCGFFNVRKAIKMIRSSRFPVMTVSDVIPHETQYKNILLPLDIERQNKEKALWAGYFSRFYGSIVHILYPEYRDEGLAKSVGDNVAFVEKLYSNLDINYEKHATKAQNHLDAFALEYATQVGAGASVIMMTKYYTLADLVTGPRERKIIGNANVPLLCINQRDDLYVLCT